jgi:DNA-binding transcriptional MerR regulator
MLDIGEVARAARLSPATLRFYEQKGLIAPCGRSGLRRLYSTAVIERLALIALGRAAGFSLEEMGTMLPLGGKPKIDKTRLAAKVDEVDELIRKLSAVREGLRHAIECDAPDFMSCPHFRRILAAAQRHPLPPAPMRTAEPPGRKTRRSREQG